MFVHIYNEDIIIYTDNMNSFSIQLGNVRSLSVKLNRISICYQKNRVHFPTHM